MKRSGWLLLIVASGMVQAQESTSFKVRESVLNNGGRPADGVVLTGPTLRVSLVAIGDPLAFGAAGASPSFQVRGGFAAAYPPPGEVLNVRFTDPQTLAWGAEHSVGRYNIYRGLVATLPGMAFGACLVANLPGLTATDVALPAPGQGYFYLITAQNLLDEEGTKGFGSGGERGNASPCP